MGNDIRQQVGLNIRDLRLKREWSLQMLADHAGISKVHLISIEKGRCEVGLLVLERILRALGVDLADLLRF